MFIIGHCCSNQLFLSAVSQDISLDKLCGCADTESSVLVSSALSKNGTFYVMPTLSAEDGVAFMLTRISDRIRCCEPHVAL